MREHPELAVKAEQLASELLSSASVEQVTAELESALVEIPLDALASRCGGVRGRGYVDETEAAWELVGEAVEPFRSDTERRAKLGHADAAASLAIGIVAGLYRVREPEMGTVVAYAGEDATNELADGVLQLAERLGIDLPGDAASIYWPRWLDLR